MFCGTLLESQFTSLSPFSSFCSTPPIAQTSLLSTGMNQNLFATPQGGLFFGRMAEQSRLAGSRSPARCSVTSKEFRLVVLSILCGVMCDECFCRWRLRLPLGRRRWVNSRWLKSLRFEFGSRLDDVLERLPGASNWRTGVKTPSVEYGGMGRKEGLV